jgi:Lon protease-like protein
MAGIIALISVFLIFSRILFAFTPVRLMQNAPVPTTSRLFSSENDRPFSDDLSKETPEERAERMKLVRKIQATFYKNEGKEMSLVMATSVQVQESDASKGNSAGQQRVLTNVPLFRAQWTELPGYQNVLNIHEPHYTHMFRRILQQNPSSWRYGHIFLPEGSKNLNNPEFRYDNPNNKACAIGTLMQISDVMDVKEDGRLGLIVQAMERFEIVNVTQHEPYAVATIRLLPEVEFGSDMSLALEDFEKWHEYENFKTLYAGCSIQRGYPQVSPLVNYDGTFFADEIAIVHGSDSREMQQAANDKDIQLVIETERKVWLAMDELLMTIRQVSGMSVPVPSQLLVLLPIDSDWPEDFHLEEYAEEMQARNMQIGTYTKSPFLRVAENPSYPPLRRARRLSYAIWILLDTILGSSAPNRQSLLECETMMERLLSACDQLQDITRAIKDKRE